MPTPKHSGTGTSMFKMLASSAAKQKFQLKDHQFLLQPVLLTVHCYQCREVFWGVNPQAYFCQKKWGEPKRDHQGKAKGHKWEMAEKNKGHNGPKSGQWPRKRSNEREMGAKGPQGTNAEEKQWAQKGHKWGKPEEEQRGGKWAQKGPREKPEEKQTKGEKAQKEAKSPRKGKGIWEPLRGVPN
ncbi:hypothetical protein niasHS_004412 [Heterodera schachtii]|uniref:Uncharacterized protein n=1 Tax=Heterodera schachtii TaxID=97005 RepID=A0ABD2JKX7_HETSC